MLIALLREYKPMSHFLSQYHKNSPLATTVLTSQGDLTANNQRISVLVFISEMREGCYGWDFGIMCTEIRYAEVYYTSTYQPIPFHSIDDVETYAYAAARVYQMRSIRAFSWNLGYLAEWMLALRLSSIIHKKWRWTRCMLDSTLHKEYALLTR